MNILARTLLTLWLMPRVAMRTWWIVAPILLVGVGTDLYRHDFKYALWGIALAVAVTLIASVAQLWALNGTGWIPPTWCVSLIRKGND